MKSTQEKKRIHIKKPLNAFMLFMKEQRQTVIEDCTLKESAAINQILGKRVSMFFTISCLLHRGNQPIVHIIQISAR